MKKTGKILSTLVIMVMLVGLLSAISFADVDVIWEQNMEARWGSANSDGGALVLGGGDGEAVPLDGTYDGEPAWLLHVTETTAWWYVSLFMNPQLDDDDDLTTMKDDGYLEFAFKGAEGGEEIKFGFSDKELFPFTATKEWVVHRIALSEFSDEQLTFASDDPDADGVGGLRINFGNNDPMKAWVGGIRIVRDTAASGGTDDNGGNGDNGGKDDNGDKNGDDNGGKDDVQTSDVGVALPAMIALLSGLAYVASRKRK